MFSGSFSGPAAADAWAAWSQANPTTGPVNNQSYNATISRTALGIYRCSFPISVGRVPYAVSILAATASTNALYIAATGPTGSIATVYNQTPTGFTMSFCIATAATTKTDPMSGSLVVFSY